MLPRSFSPYQPYGKKLPTTPWLCAYWPVMNVARDGQQSGNESTAFVNFVPRAASSLRTFGIFARSAAAWSSVITTRMFGRPSFAFDAGRASAEPGIASTRIPSAAISHALTTSDRNSVCDTVSTCWYGDGVPTRTKTQLRTSRQESRERIIAAATELVRRTSYGALTVDDVMREAGFGRTIFYRHFDDLGDLLRRAAREAFEGLLEA